MHITLITKRTNMSDITLTPIGSGYNLSKFNINFDAIEDLINTELLHTVGGNNVMSQSLGMNSNRILNLPVPVAGSEPLINSQLAELASNDIGNATNIVYTDPELNVYQLDNFLDTVEDDVRAVEVDLSDLKEKVLKVDSVAAMKALSPVAGSSIATVGYYDTKSLGAGTYLIKTAAEATSDGDIIDTYGNHTLANGNVAILQYEDGVNIRSYGAKGDGVTDDTLIIQAAIEATIFKQDFIRFPSGLFLVTDTLIIYSGTQITGNMGNGYTAWNNIVSDIDAATIKFQPSSPKTLMRLVEHVTNFVFKGQNTINGIRLLGDSTSNSAICLDLTFAYHNRYSNLQISGFDIGISSHATINNHFESVFIQLCDICVDTGTITTTDVFTQCTFTQSRIGVRSRKAFGVRFINCLIEQIDDYGFDISAEDGTITVDGLYCEDVPFDNSVADHSIFRVGGAGATSSSTTQLIVSNCTLRGRNSAPTGAVFAVNQCDGISISNVFSRKHDTVISTTASVRDRSILISNLSSTAYTTLFNDPTKIQGTYSNPLTDPNLSQRQILSQLLVKTISPETGTTVTINGQTSGQTFLYPNNDNVSALGLGSNRWSVVYAGTGTINTSDEREKCDWEDFSKAESKAVVEIKGVIQKYKWIRDVEDDKDSAKWHIGVGAQTVKNILTKYELDWTEYAFLSYEEGDDGEGIYGIRYNELLMFIIANT